MITQLIVSLFRSLLKDSINKKSLDNRKLIRYPIFNKIVGIVSIFFGLVILILLIYTLAFKPSFVEEIIFKESLAYFILPSAFILVGSLLFFVHKNICISYDENSISKTSIFNITRTYLFKEISSIEMSKIYPDSIIVRTTNNRWFRIDKWMEGVSSLEQPIRSNTNISFDYKVFKKLK
jgi:hypothetical protein